MKSLGRQRPADPQEVLAEIRTIYFGTTERTIQHDFAHAIELLTTLAAEEDREKARVYMDGLAQMRSDWGRTRSGRSGQSGTSGRSRKSGES
ncbi:MAG: hypothetical protein A3G77_02255 [Acidobacteria bacterium RIFCSPLOWO2_12_FULL_68_19]|nr:MAG: hypothetical protein A3G77_02255 [Acidobacteria bacterium RIFCSPLOWO2_12_FULL_68_19]